MNRAVTAGQFRKLALSLPEATEQSHMEHPDFRVGGKIFATLGHPDNRHAMVKLTPDQQEALVRSNPDAFFPAAGAWGRRGATHVVLARASEKIAGDALLMAWRNTAPRRLVKERG